jgi:hypothetical protein
VSHADLHAANYQPAPEEPVEEDAAENDALQAMIEAEGTPNTLETDTSRGYPSRGC